MHGLLVDQPQIDSMDHRASSPKRARTEERKRVAIFGGSFNPITNAHLNVASEMIHSGQTDEVWLLPCGPRPDKPSVKTSTLDRVIMCHLAVATTFGSRFPISVCSDELAEEKALSSYIMMNRMEVKHPSIDFAFVVGSDLLSSMRNWSADGIPDAGERLWNEKKFLVIPRPDASGDGGVAVADLPDNFNVIGPAFEGGHLVTTRLSSSEVRRRINGAGRAVRHEQGQLISADECVTLPLPLPLPLPWLQQARARRALLARRRRDACS